MKTTLIGRYADVLDDETAPQRLDVVSLRFPADDRARAQGVLDYCRDVLLDPTSGFRSEREAHAHCVRTLRQHIREESYLSETEALNAAVAVLKFILAHPLGVTISD